MMEQGLLGKPYYGLYSPTFLDKVYIPCKRCIGIDNRPSRCSIQHCRIDDRNRIQGITQLGGNIQIAWA
jgi:hypothetical protein